MRVAIGMVMNSNNITFESLSHNPNTAAVEFAKKIVAMAKK